MKDKKNNLPLEPNSLSEITKRLDGILMLLLKTVFSDESKKMNLFEVIPFLKSVGYTPTEIANLLGKKKATEISTYLYPKK